MRLSALIYFYVRRLRTHPVQEALAGLGVAIGVALVFAVQVANTSITAGSRQIVRSIVGAANLQILARGPSGLDESLVHRVQSLPGVDQVAPVLDLSATLRGAGGRTAVVELVSAELNLAVLDGLSNVLPLEQMAHGGIMLPSATAHALGVSTTIGHEISSPLPRVSLFVRGRSVPVDVSAVLGSDTVGELSGAMAAIAPLQLVQRVADLPDRVTRILVQTKPGDESLVRGELARLVAGRLSIAPADQDVSLLEQATVANNEATGFFAFVSGFVGLLLAFNAMLLSTPERRRVIADLRIQGARPMGLVKLLLFQSVCLGVLASLVGVLIGDLLSRGVFHQTPGYLAAAFPLGTQTVIGWEPVVIAFVGGVLATCLAAASPLLDLRPSRAVDAVYVDGGEPGHRMGGSMRARMFAGALVLLAVSMIAVPVFGPRAAVVAIIGLSFAALLTIPFSFTLIVRIAEHLAHRSRAGRLNMLLVATRALRATTVRSLALAATGAIAVFGSVAAQGAHEDLLKGLYQDYSQYVSTTDLWVTNRNDELATDVFIDNGLQRRIEDIRGVKTVRAYQGGFLDMAGRRVWLIARSPNAPSIVPASQVLDGDAPTVDTRLRRGDWITVSKQLAASVGVVPGQALTLPTPSGRVSYRVAATTTNLGWPAGAIVMNDLDYRSAWKTTEPSALEVDIEPGANEAVVESAVSNTLGPDSGLRVQTSEQRAAQADGVARQGLSRLTQISLLLMAAAALSMAAAMGASIWQRRPSLASLRIQSFRPGQLQIVLLCESVLVLGTGSAVGLAAGLYGHDLIDTYLRLVTGFPAPFVPAWSQAFQTLFAIVLAALIVLCAPGYLASRASPGLALDQ